MSVNRWHSYSAAALIRRYALLVPLLLSTPVMAASVDELVSQARELLAGEQFEQAFELLDKESVQYAGNPEYDYMLGLAALRSEKPEQAVFALERAVQADPGYAAARMELVSAYLQLGLDRQAEAQLAILQTQQPPEAAREVMSRYQDILRPRLSETPDPVRLLGLSAGYDSNVGSYPDMGLNLGGVLLSVKPVSSAYGLLRGTWWQPVKLNDSQRLDFTLHGQVREYQDQDAKQFNLGLLHGGVLLNTKLDPVNSYGVGFQVNRLWLDRVVFRNHMGANAFWERRLDAGLSGQVGVKLYRYRFDPKLHDYDETTLSAELDKRWSPALRGALLLDLTRELAKENRSGGDAARARLGGKFNYRFNQRDQADVELAWSQTHYSDKYSANTLYNPSGSDSKRTDNTLDLSLRWRHLLAREWQVDTDLTYRKQDSSVRFYDIDRWTAQLTVLRYF